jgi:hypothetical protein
MNMDLSDFLPFGSISPESGDEAPARTVVRRRRTATGKRSRAADPAGQSAAGEDTVWIMLGLPRPMLESLQAEAGTENVGDLIRSVLQAFGHGPGAGSE